MYCKVVVIDSRFYANLVVVVDSLKILLRALKIDLNLNSQEKGSVLKCKTSGYVVSSKCKTRLAKRFMF